MMERNRPDVGQIWRWHAKQNGEGEGGDGGGGGVYGTDGACEHTSAYLERFWMEIAVMIMLWLY